MNECSTVTVLVCIRKSFVLNFVCVLLLAKCENAFHRVYVCVCIRVSIQNGNVMDEMNETRSRWNFHFVSFLLATHLFIHSFSQPVIRSKHCTVYAHRRSVFTSRREFNARYLVKPQKTLAKVKKMR